MRYPNPFQAKDTYTNNLYFNKNCTDLLQSLLKSCYKTCGDAEMGELPLFH